MVARLYKQEGVFNLETIGRLLENWNQHSKPKKSIIRFELPEDLVRLNGPIRYSLRFSHINLSLRSRYQDLLNRSRESGCRDMFIQYIYTCSLRSYILRPLFSTANRCFYVQL